MTGSGPMAKQPIVLTNEIIFAADGSLRRQCLRFKPAIGLKSDIRAI
jgi:hypothetical protein